MNAADEGKRERLATLGMRLVHARLRSAVVEGDDEARGIDELVAWLLCEVLRIGDAALAVHWFLGTQGVRSQCAMWPGRAAALTQDDIFERLRPGSAVALIAKAPDARGALLVLARDDEGHAALRLRIMPTHESPAASLGALHAMAPDIFDITLIPVGDLRCIAWQNDAASTLPGGTRLRLHLTVAAWWRQRGEHDAQHAARPAASPSWVLAAHDAWNTGNLDDRLQWVQIESFLSHRLWDAGRIVRLEEGSTASLAATALLACGHGTARDFGDGGRRRGAGLATTLPRLPQLRQMLLNCCEMGRVDEVAGDPRGLLAQAFTLGLRFAIAPLTRVHDFDMALFSLAYQWCLHCAFEQSTTRAEVDWVGVFERLQASLRMGEWPPGFAHWLADELPAALRHTVPDVPAARADEDAELERKDWFHVLRALSEELAMPDTVPRPSRCWNEFYDSVSLALSQRAPDRVRATALGVIAIGE